jgi:glutamate racemase
MSASGQPIGIFDSGVGGLTVAKAIHARLPAEDLIYLGDTARFPYGNKSPATVVAYARQITQFLIKQGVKAVAVACNTATAHALETLQNHFTLPVLGVIEPGVKAALAATQNGRIGIIGTAGTVRSEAYSKALLEARPGLELTSVPAPLLVDLIEQNWLAHDAMRMILDEYLAPFKKAQVDTLVLACTHYPLVEELIGAMMGPEVRLVDSAHNMAESLAERLKSEGLLRPESAHRGTIKIFTTDYSIQFAEQGARFLGQDVESLELAKVESS